MTEPLSVCIAGAAGRMGRRLVALATAADDLTLAAAVDSERHSGQDAGDLAGVGSVGVSIETSLPTSVGAIIDFSVPDAVPGVAAHCADCRIPLVEATTGLMEPQRQAVLDASHVTPVVFAPSMSTAVNIAMKLVAEAGAALEGTSGDVDVEIIERHHRHKEDAPSGTALKFGEVVSAAMGQSRHVHGREGRTGPRPRDEIGYHAVRVGDDVGQHTIVFGMPGETLEIAVRGQSRDSYAYGALTAARWLVGRPPGLYSMADVLGLS